VIEEKEKSITFLFSSGKARLDDRSMAENKVIERNLNLKHLTSKHTLILYTGDNISKCLAHLRLASDPKNSFTLSFSCQTHPAPVASPQICENKVEQTLNPWIWWSTSSGTPRNKIWWSWAKLPTTATD
jgi:hypothetical protein